MAERPHKAASQEGRASPQEHLPSATWVVVPLLPQAAPTRYLQVGRLEADIRAGARTPNATTTLLDDEQRKLFSGDGALELQMDNWRMKTSLKVEVSSLSRRGKASPWH
jgi:hypothetical protein